MLWVTTASAECSALRYTVLHWTYAYVSLSYVVLVVRAYCNSSAHNGSYIVYTVGYVLMLVNRHYKIASRLQRSAVSSGSLGLL